LIRRSPGWLFSPHSVHERSTTAYAQARGVLSVGGTWEGMYAKGAICVDRRYNAGMDERGRETQMTPSRRLQFSLAALFGAMTVVAACAGVFVSLPKPEDSRPYPAEGRVMLTDGTPIQSGYIESCGPIAEWWRTVKSKRGSSSSALSLRTMAVRPGSTKSL